MKRASQRHLPVYVSQVSITPLLDLVLVLLLVFIVAVPLLRREKMKGVGEGAPALLTKAPPKQVVLNIRPDQSIWLDDQPVSGENLLPALKAHVAKQPDCGVLVRMPDNFAAGSLARLMDEMHRAGIRQTAVEVIENLRPR